MSWVAVDPLVGISHSRRSITGTSELGDVHFRACPWLRQGPRKWGVYISELVRGCVRGLGNGGCTFPSLSVAASRILKMEGVLVVVAEPRVECLPAGRREQRRSSPEVGESSRCRRGRPRTQQTRQRTRSRTRCAYIGNPHIVSPESLGKPPTRPRTQSLILGNLHRTAEWGRAMPTNTPTNTLTNTHRTLGVPHKMLGVLACLSFL